MPDITFELKSRDLYLNKLIAFKDMNEIKVVTGIRRCGKSSLLKLMQKYLKDSGIEDSQIIDMNFESMAYSGMDYKEFYDYVKMRILPDRKMYLFFDELQRIERWEDAVNSFRVDFDCDIYITGSNAYLLSSEFSTYLSGRYVEVKMYPLSFREFLDFYGYEVKEYKFPLGEMKHRIYGSNGEQEDPKDVFNTYMYYGGMPAISEVGFVQERALDLLEGIYSTAIIKDVLGRERWRGQRRVTDPELLRKIVMFLADNIGNNTSLRSIANTLVNEEMLENKNEKGKKKEKGANKPATQTVSAYVGALLESYLFYEIKRFDIKGKELLRTNGKYYIVDTGIRNYLLGYRDIDIGHVIENIVYFELLRRGYDVAVGKIGDSEIDFIATKNMEKIYYQVTDQMVTKETRDRELNPLREIKDNYEKAVIILNTDTTAPIEGIQIIPLIDFLLSSVS